MTSPADQKPIPATNTSATTVSSYASAASAPEKPVETQSPPVAASGSHPTAAAAVVTTSASPAQNAKQSPDPSSIVNGKPAASPAVPRGPAPNGAHARHPSVTMAANGPNSFAANGGHAAAAAKSGIQFGFGSPSVAQSSPQPGTAAPIPIPGGPNPRVSSPAHSPSPIPQPSASGGRPPSSLQQPGAQMTFGSLGSDGERHMRQGSVPPNPAAMGAQQPSSHFRRESSHSVHSEGPPGGPNRANFAPQGGRGRGGFNPHGNNYNHQMGYPPNNQFRNGPNQGRGMPPAFQPQGPRNMGYPNSPQPNHRSPAMVPSMPNTPNMPTSTMPGPMPMQQPPAYHYGPPMPAQGQQTYGYPPPQQQQVDQFGRPYYGVPGYMQPPQANSPGFNQGFTAPPTFHQGGHPHSMSRTPSQPERPPSASQHGGAMANKSQPGPQIPKGPRKSAAIVIKTESGQVVDPLTFKVAPHSPSPSPANQQTRTPPVTASHPTPPSKPSTPAHSRTESQAPAKTAKEIQDELKEKIKQATQNNQSPAAAAGSATTPAAAAAPATTSAAAPEAKAEEEGSPAAPAEAPAAEKPAEPKKEEAKAPKPEEPPKKEETEEEEMERIIREMEEEDARREAQEAEHRAKADAEKAAAKKKAEEDRKANAAEEDRKLREQEREMERLEEEKERKRKEAESGGKPVSVAEALSGPSTDKVDDVADKLSGMKIAEKATTAAGDGKPTTAEKRGAKPAALNLTPLNTKPVEPPQPSAALQSLKSARFLQVMDQDIYPEGILSPNPALNAAVAKKGKTFQYDSKFLLQFQKVFTEQPSLEFHQQVKSLIGDGDARSARAQTPGSARQGSRGGAGAGGPGAPGGFSMGAFNAPTGRTLPRGTTSQQRFEESSSRGGAGGAMPFQRAGGFPLQTMSRTPSTMGPNSPRQSSRSTRGSRRGDHSAKEAQAAKTMPLTAGLDVAPIVTSSTGWKPSSVGRGAGAGAGGPGAPGSSNHMDPEMVQRKVKAALNKMTPENFERISDQILTIAHQSKDETDGRTLRQVIQLTFEKATDEAHWASMYAKFCKKMLETMSPEIKDERIKDKAGNTVSGGNLFRKYLLNRCQEEFERGWTGMSENKDEEGNTEEAKANQEPGAKKEAVMLSDEYYAAAAAKRRGLGLVQFIGELYKLGMLTERIMVECVHKLVDHQGIPDEAEIESLSKLLRTIGRSLDQSEKGRPMMDVYFGRIQNMIDLPELPSRLKFMLMDVVDLRKANWIGKDADKGPKTLEEVRAEAEAAQAAKAQESARNNQRGGGRAPAGRGDARNFSAGYSQQTSNQVGMDDLRRLKGSANRSTSGNVTLGPTSMFSSRSNSGRRLGPMGSLGRPGEDSGASSRSGTPLNRENSSSHSNAFSLLANMESENPASPPSTAATPATKAATDSKKEGE